MGNSFQHLTGFFITFEGPEGCGKSTQISLFTSYLKTLDIGFELTREPGGTSIGESIRKILLDPGNKAMNPIAEAYLYAASRAQHVNEKILPLLEKGINVISDRYLDSSLIYQGVGRGIGMERVMKINEEAVAKVIPGLCFVIMVRPEIGLKRAKETSRTDGYEKGDRLEQEKRDFHNAIYQGFKQLPEFRKDIVLIDGERSIEEVHAEIKRIFSEKYNV